jgi:hypothetical protein
MLSKLSELRQWLLWRICPALSSSSPKNIGRQRGDLCPRRTVFIIFAGRFCDKIIIAIPLGFVKGLRAIIDKKENSIYNKRKESKGVII